jgi:serine/threonine protein kinase
VAWARSTARSTRDSNAKWRYIAHVHGLEESSGATALVMELVEGEDLSHHVARGPLPIREALTIARQIAVALEAAHEQAGGDARADRVAGGRV